MNANTSTAITTRNGNGLQKILCAYDDSDDDYENSCNGSENSEKRLRLDPASTYSGSGCEFPEIPTRTAPNLELRKTENSLSPSLSGDLRCTKTAEAEASAALPLPAIFANSKMNSNDVEILPDGRIRSFPHERGNWASFVYIPFGPAEGITLLHETLTNRIKTLNFTQRVIHICDDFHLSLTKTLIFRHHWIDPFIQSIKKKLLKHKSFDVTFGEFRVLVNDEKTRSFLSLEVFPANGLYELVNDCDDCLVDYGLEKYYENPSFHISIGWMVGNQEVWMNHNIVPYMNHEWSRLSDNDPSLRSTTVSSIVFKTGNKGYEFAF